MYLRLRFSFRPGQSPSSSVSDVSGNPAASIISGGVVYRDSCNHLSTCSPGSHDPRCPDSSAPSTVNTSLLASTMLGHRSTGQGVFCSLYRAVDHTRAQCALACLEPTTPPVAPQRFLPLQAGRRPRVPPVCYAWNRGACPYDSKCNYRHVCSVCTAPAHKAVDCPQAGLPTPHPLLAHPRHP